MIRFSKLVYFFITYFYYAVWYDLWYYSITYLDSSFINPVSAHAVSVRSTDKEWHNPSGNSSDGRGDPLEQSCLGVSNLKTRTLYQQLTIIVQTAYSIYIYIYIESVRVDEQTQRVRQNSLNANFWLTTDRLADYFFKIWPNQTR